MNNATLCDFVKTLTKEYLDVITLSNRFMALGNSLTRDMIVWILKELT